MILNRRELLQSGSLMLGASLVPTFTAACASSRGPSRLPIPALIDASSNGGSYSLRAQSGETRFFGGAESRTNGFNGAFLGPTVRVRSGERVRASVTNALRESTTVYWHGLLVPSEADGGPHHIIEPGRTWRTQFNVRQRGATLWYHAHPHPRTGQQVYSGLAGMMIVDDGADEAFGLPTRYGEDDVPVVLRDAVFDGEELVYPEHPMMQMLGVRGSVILANGAPAPLLAVPPRLVRLRIVNAANARVFDLSMSDSREMIWIGTDGGLLERPVRLNRLMLAPGQRAEILVDFSDGRPADLTTGRDPVVMMMGGGMGMGRGRMMDGMADPLEKIALVLRIQPDGRSREHVRIPELLAPDTRPNAADALRHRRLTLTMGMMGGGMDMMGGGMRGGMGMMGQFGIDGQPFDMDRIDQQVRLGDTEIWEVSGDMMPHPFHMHGVHFHVLSRGGRPPDSTDQGLKDTVLVQGAVELLVRFTMPAAEHHSCSTATLWSTRTAA